MQGLQIRSKRNKGHLRRDPPNIIIFLADDLGYGDLSSQGHPTIHTPNLDQLAREGLRFTSMYSVSPVCSASRYALLTGKVPGRAGFPWVLYPGSERGIHRDENTLAEVLKTSGYATSIIGKWHLGSSKRQYLPLQNGFDEYFGLPYSNDMIPPHWRPLALFQGNDTLELNPKQHLLPPQFDEKAKQFIRERKDKPFFLFFSFSMPHVPLRPGLAVRGQSLRGRYGDAVEEIDQSVGAVIDVLKEEDLLENTIIWFTSDNGPWLKKGIRGGSAGLLRDGKGSTWEGGVRVPGIVYWKDTIEKGRVSPHPVSLMDIFATSIALSGGKIPKDRIIDGQDLSAFLLHEQPPEENPIFFYGPEHVQAIRLGEWKLHLKTISQQNSAPFNGRIPLLFNVNEDPSEKHDLSNDQAVLVDSLWQLVIKHESSLDSFWKMQD